MSSHTLKDPGAGPSAPKLHEPTLRDPVLQSQTDTEAAGGFPRSPSAFDSDPRISFSKLDSKYILETEDGQEFEFDTALKRWVQAVCCLVCFFVYKAAGERLANVYTCMLGR